MARKFKVDMTGVESYTRCPEGEFTAKCKKIDMGTVQGSGDDCLKAQFEVLSGEGKGCTVYETFSLGEKALWKLKSFLEAIGVKANGKISLDLDKLEGKICTIEVIHDEYNGNKRAKISSYSKYVPEDTDDYDDDIDDDEEEEEEVKPSKKPATKARKAPAKKPTPVEDDDEDEDEEDDEEEPPKPSKKSKPAPEKKAPAKSTKKAKKPEPEPEEDDDDDDDWEEDDD